MEALYWLKERYFQPGSYNSKNIDRKQLSSHFLPFCLSVIFLFVLVLYFQNCGKRSGIKVSKPCRNQRGMFGPDWLEYRSELSHSQLSHKIQLDAKAIQSIMQYSVERTIS